MVRVIAVNMSETQRNLSVTKKQSETNKPAPIASKFCIERIISYSPTFLFSIGAFNLKNKFSEILEKLYIHAFVSDT